MNFINYWNSHGVLELIVYLLSDMPYILTPVYTNILYGWAKSNLQLHSHLDITTLGHVLWEIRILTTNHRMENIG